MLLNQNPIHATILDYPKLDPVNDNVAGSYTADQAGAMNVTSVIGANTINATVLKASAGRLLLVEAFNINAADSWIKFYNKATAPDPSAGVDVPVLRLRLPPSSENQKLLITFGKGAGFSTGIAYVIVAGSSDTDETAISAGECLVNLGYI